MHEVTMPRLSDSMAEGTIVRWLKASGDEVRRGEEIVEIETDKATLEYEADVDGTLTIVAAAGQTVAVGGPIATIGSGAPAAVTPGRGSDAPAAPHNGAGGQAAPQVAAPSRATVPAQLVAGGAPRVKAAPVARRAAQRLGVALESVVGTGPYGRILKADVVAASLRAAPAAAAPAAVAPEVAAAAPAAAPAAVTAGQAGGSEPSVVELTRTQALIARRMVESRTTVPDFSLEVDVDMSAAIALRAELGKIADPAPSLNDLVIKAAAIALTRHPRVNGSYRDGRFELQSEVNVGLAVAAEDALVVPVVRDANTKSLGAIAAVSRGLAERVRAGTVTPQELSGGTFTVSNLGMFGIDRFEGIINAPQAAILCVGAASDRPVARDGRVEIAPMMTLTLACDHRILYGAHAAAYLAEVRSLLEQPLALAL